MAGPIDEPNRPPATAGHAALESYPLLDSLVHRRSRRFAAGTRLRGGGLTFESAAQPVALTEDEEAILAFAGSGVTGHVFGELPYQPGAGPETGGGQIMMSTVGRTSSSADAVATVSLCITRDDGTFVLRRPQDFPLQEFGELTQLSREHRFTELYQRSRVRLSDRRTEIRRELPYTPPFNKWSANVPGATYFVPLSDITGLYLTVLFAAVGEEFAFFFHDDKDWRVRPAGIAQFARSKGGHLYDDVHDGRVGTIDEMETYLVEILGFEQGLMIQNIALAAETLGLGGFPHYAAHRFGWPRALGCRMRDRTFAQVLHKGSPQPRTRPPAAPAPGLAVRRALCLSRRRARAGRAGDRGRSRRGRLRAARRPAPAPALRADAARLGRPPRARMGRGRRGGR